ncbi:hypothetical protein ALQ00_05426 [Pseudomonas syringae pv. tomato]|nr:hypothetical protein ALQ00_05426 [Pseudomonas syringae pv. tomato]
MRKTRVLPRRKTKIQLHSVTVSSAGAEFLYHQRSILFICWSMTCRRKLLVQTSRLGDQARQITLAARYPSPTHRPGQKVERVHSQLEIRSVHRLASQQSALIIVKPGAKPPAQPSLLESMLALTVHPP